MTQARFIQEGRSIDHTPDAKITAGDVVVLGGLAAIAKLDIAAGALGALAVTGVFDVVHAADVLDPGAAVYWDADGDPVGGTAGTGAATATSTDNTFMGWAPYGAAVDDETVRVILFGAPAVTVNHYGPLNNAITDPGDGEAIPVTASGTVAIVTAGAETRTLAAPSFVGQELVLYMLTDGGNGVITVTGCDDGNTITFANVGEMVRLVGVGKDAGIVWRVVADPDSIVSTV